MEKIVVALFGPTGIGKTDLSLKLAKNHGEIVSVDSLQVYRYMDIGTAKLSFEKRKLVKHHLVDILNPDGLFTAGDFKRFCEKEIPLILERGNIPFLVGGTGFYFNTLMNGIVEIPKISFEVRKRVKEKSLQRGQARLFQMLELIDKETSQRIHFHDKQRTERALEVFLETGKKLSEYYKQEKKVGLSVKYLKIGLNCEREKLYERINDRVDKMVQEGLIEEVRKLLKMGYTRESAGMKGIGYTEFLDYFDGVFSYAEAVEEIKKHTRHYAKRQLTWFRSIPDVHWFYPEQEREVEQLVRSHLKDY